MISVLFVCLGNICRSPAAEAVLRKKAEDQKIENLEISSCGAGDWHIGELADERMRQVAKVRGIIITKRAEHFKPEYLDQYDFILASDHEVISDLYYYAKTPEHKSKIQLITAYSPSYQNEEVPDPYYSGIGAFDEVINILEDACEGLIDHLRNFKRSA